MATTKLVEPYVKVTEKIRQYPVQLDIDSSANIGGVIVAPTGPALSFVSGPHDFLDKYTIDGEIPRNADRTFINAYYLSFSAGLVIARSMNTKAVNGLYFYTKIQKEYKLYINISNESIYAILINNILYWYNSGDETFDNFIESVKGLTWDQAQYEIDPTTGAYKIDTDGNKIPITGESKGDPKYSNTVIDELKEYKNKNKTIKNIVVSDLDSLASNLEDNLGSGITVIYSATSGALVITPPIGSTFTKPTVNTFGTDNLTGIESSAEYSESDNTDKLGLDAHTMNFKDKVALSEYDKIKITWTDLTKGVKSTWAFVYGAMAYYHGPIDKTIFDDYSLKSCDSLDDVATSISNMPGMTAHVGDGVSNDVDGTLEDLNTIYINYSKGNRLYTATRSSEDTTIFEIGLKTTQPGVNDASDDDYVENTSKYEDYEKKLFAVYPNNPQSENKYRLTIQPDDNELFYITLSNGDTTNSYTVSCYADALDQSGSNAFIENLNAVDTEFTYITNSDFKVDGTTNQALDSDGDPISSLEEGDSSIYAAVPKATQAFSFGNSGLDLSASKKVSCLINAIYDLEDQELYDIEYLAPMGIVDLQFIKNYVYVGHNNYWFTPVDIPWDKTNSNSIKSYCFNVDCYSNVEIMGPFDKNTGLTGWMNYIACSTLYYTKIFNNKSASSEFAPVFDLTNGVLDFTNPVYMLGKEDRVKLLNFKAPANFLIYDQKHDCYYLNDNWTHQVSRDIVSEEQNRRMVNKINQDLRKLLQKFKGRLNTETTRNDVITTISYYFSTVIMTQEYKPNKYETVCDTTNNTTEIINANKLAVTVRVRLENAIKYIDVLTDVFPLGVDFSS